MKKLVIGVGQRSDRDTPGCCFAKLAVLASALLFSGVSWASTAACTSTATLLSFAPQSNGAGCYDVDQTFSNFNVTNQSSGTATNQTTGTDDIHATNGFSVVTSPWTE